MLGGLTLTADDSSDLVGTIQSIDEDEPRLSIMHEGIPDIADEAGLLEVAVLPGDHAIATVGRMIKGKLNKLEDGYFLNSIWPVDDKVERTMSLINRDLTRPRIGQSQGLLKVGDDLPRFALYNQLGNLVTPEDWENKLVILNFIFTRSRVPSMCLATAKRMADLQDRLREEGHGNSVVLLSLSLDPEFDTPGVSYTYLEELGVDHDSFWLLSGSLKTLNFLREKIGVVATPSEKTIINHSMVTLIADREGKLFYRKPGSRWELDDIYGRLEILLNAR